MWAERPEPEVLGIPANAAEDAVAAELSRVWLHPENGSFPSPAPGARCFPWVLAKAFLLLARRSSSRPWKARQKTLSGQG